MRKVFIALLVVLLVGCQKDRSTENAFALGKLAQVTVLNQEVKINPSGFSPLAAQITFTSDVKTTVKLTVVGKHGAVSNIVNTFAIASLTHQIPILGLYADYLNEVDVDLFNEQGVDLGTSVIKIQTDPLISDMPKILIDVPNANSTNEMNLVSYFGFDKLASPQHPFIFDDFGDIRWYLDYRSSSVLNNLYYEDGVKRLANGNYFFADTSSEAIYEVDVFGNILHSWSVQNLGYQFSHEVIEMPNGNFLCASSKIGQATKEDQVIEIDRSSGSMVKSWDLKNSLQYGRQALTTDLSDWFHINALDYDKTDGGILVSGRVQGVVKLDADNNVEWILAPHKDWGLAGNGLDLNKKLLTPLDGNGKVLENSAVITGLSNAGDFEWNWCQHGSKFLANGEIVIFDDGDQRNFGTTPLYSRAVRYLINPNTMTVKQVWTYGKERGEELFSKIVSSALPDPVTGNMVMSSGDITTNGTHGEVILVDTDTKNVLFEATIIAPKTSGAVTFHRTNRVTMYPNN